MGRHNSFPKAGDRIRLAIPSSSSAPETAPRYGTVIERSCGRSNALRVRWDSVPGRAAASDAVVDTWLADAGWYWDKAQLEVVDDHEGVTTPASEMMHGVSATGADGWLSASPRATAPAGGIDGSLDAVAEWEAALASEIVSGTETSWEELLANALRNGASLPTPRKAAHPPGRPSARRAVDGPQPHEEPVIFHARGLAAAGVEGPGSAPQPEPGIVDESEITQAPVACAVQAWKGDDILPSGAGKKRWGRR